jgi:glyoxylase-like metal-dependent hydrolase (beta-lactamase superfamily II)
MELWPRVHRIEGEFGGNALCMYLLRGASRTVLIDSGVPATPETTILPYLASIDFPPDEIDTIIVTHASADHFGGNAAMRAVAPACRIVAHHLDVGSIEDIEHHLDENFAPAARLGCPWPPDVFALTRDFFGPPVPVDWAVQGGETLDLGAGWVVTLLHTPGHTPGHLSVWNPRHQALFIGDAVLGKGVSSLAGKLASPPPYFEVNDYTQTLTTVRDLEPEVLLATHYPVMRGDGVGAFLDASWDFVRRCEAVLGTTLAQTETLTLCEAVAVLEAQVGPPGAVWRLTARAHLDALVAVQRAAVVTHDDQTYWTRRD